MRDFRESARLARPFPGADALARTITLRCLHIIKATGIGGAERHLLTLLPGLQASGAQVRVLVATAVRGDRFLEQAAASGIDARPTPAGPRLSPRLYARIRREIGEFRPTVVHTHLVHADVHGQPAAAHAGVPGVSSLHSAHSFYQRLPYRPVCRYASRRAARTIAISAFVKQFAEAGRLNAPGAIRMVPYGIDVEQWRSTPSELELARARLGVEDDDVVFGVVSRLVPGKGHAMLIDAFSGALAKAPNARLLIAGDGPLRARLAASVSDELADRVRFVGFVADVRSFISASDALVFPTTIWPEGFGLGALEAMASARPVIATRVGPLPEVVAADRTGILVSPRDPTELSTAIGDLAQDADARVAMGRRGRRRAEECFSTTRMVESTLRVYSEIAR